MIDVPGGDFILGPWGGTAGAMALIYGVRALWRRVSRDRTEVAKDRSEINIIKMWEERCATLTVTLDRVYEERNRAIEQHAALAAKVPMLERRLAELTAEVHALREQLYGKRLPPATPLPPT